jgi:DNA-binding transcriptional ArsR family regulator
MANQNFKAIAMAQLGYTLRDIRILSRREEIYELTASLEAEARRTRETDTVRQSTVANVLMGFVGFATDPDQYGPTCADVHNVLLEGGAKVKRNAVAQHLAKLKNAGFIDSARKMECEPGKRGAPPVFFFLTSSEDAFASVLSGETVAK